jgi:tungstate transport system ATP-binding protein
MTPMVASILPLALESVGFAAGGRGISHDVSARLASGPRSVILGANGAGKSVLLRLCHGLLAPSAGAVRWAVANGDAQRRQAMVFQRPVMLRRSALANVVYALRVAGLARAEARRRAQSALEHAGLAALADAPARALSGGEQQRVALARAWALEPEVLFLDEPTANLDPAATRAVEAAIVDLHSTGTKIVMTTHNLGQARRLADEILFLHRGRLVEHAPAERFFARPATEEAAAFLREELPW